MPGEIDDFVIELAGGVNAAAAARGVVRARTSALPEPLGGDVLLLITELVTNAVHQGGVGPEGSLRLECRSDGDRLRFLVTGAGTGLLENGGPAGQARAGANGDHARGWRLLLVEQIAERWGIVTAPPGTCVWFEVAV